MLKIAFVLVFILGINHTTIAVQAGEKLENNNRVDHYEGAQIDNKKEAMELLLQTSKEIAQIASNEDLNETKMEIIHETSYKTEDAVKVLSKKSKFDMTPLAETLEAVHLSSEAHQSEKLRRALILYQVELIEYIKAQ